MKFLEPQTEKVLKSLEEHYLDKVFASRSRKVQKHDNPMGDQIYHKSKNAIRKPHQNLGEMKEIWSKIAKRPPKH